jgi:hypothetical protein
MGIVHQGAATELTDDPMIPDTRLNLNFFEERERYQQL